MLTELLSLIMVELYFSMTRPKSCQGLVIFCSLADSSMGGFQMGGRIAGVLLMSRLLQISLRKNSTFCQLLLLDCLSRSNDANRFMPKRRSLFGHRPPVQLWNMGIILKKNSEVSLGRLQNQLVFLCKNAVDLSAPE